MATRASSRRSAGGEQVFNRAMIGLLPYTRLKEECEKRGLPTDGNKERLATRLEDSLDGVYEPPPTPTPTIAPTDSSPSTSRSANAKTTPKSRTNSAKAAPAKRTPRRKTSVTSAGEEDSPTQPSASPPKKKPRRNSTKKELSSRDCSLPPKEEEVFEEEFSLTIVTAPPAPDFDSEDDEPLIHLAKKAAVEEVTTSPTTAAAAEVENEGNEEKEVRKKKRRRSKEDDDLESGVMLPKGDSEWVPPEESEKRVTRDSAKKRTRRNTMEVKREEDEGESEEPSSGSMPILDPEIYDQEVKEEADDKEQSKASTDAQLKSCAGDGGKKAKKESSAIERPRTISITTPAVVEKKEKRRESVAAAAPRPAKEKPATQIYAEMMIAQKKAAEEARAAAAAAAANGGSTATGTPVSSTVAKGRDSQEKEGSGGASPLATEKKPELMARRDSIGGSPAADAAASKGFSMTARRNAPPRPAPPQIAGSSDLLGGLLEKQQVLLEKKVKSSAETEAEKIRIVSQIKQRAPDLRIREETVMAEKERLQREKEERERAREEREKKERERKIAVINAPSRPIPPPPPLPAIKLENSPSEQQPTAAASSQEDVPPPKYEPLDENEDMMELDDPSMEEQPEYEPLSTAGPSMAPHDRSVARAILEKTKREKRHKDHREHTDHGLVAPEVPFSADDPFLLKLSDKLQQIKRQREESPIPNEIRECMDELLKRVEAKVEKEQKWERRTKRKSEYQVEREREEQKKRAQMMRDPRALLAKATNILESMHSTGSMDGDDSMDGTSSTAAATAAASAIHISQDVAEPGSYEDDTEERPLPEFHGEPVPSDDDEALFLEAAGLPKKDKRPKHPVVEEEAPPSHEHILMDYYNACLQIKSAADKPWLIEPDNENGLALMWGGVRANHGYVLPWREEKKSLVFQIKITEHQSIRHVPFMEQEAHDVRIGFSLRASPNIMGESPLSWAFSTTGKKCANNVFQEWGDPVEIGDVVTAVLDFSLKCLSFYKNEQCMGVAFRDMPLPEEEGDAVYAHVCVKNCKVAVNLGEFPEVDGGWIWGVEEEGGREGKGETAPTTIPLNKRDVDWLFPTEIERRRYEMSRLPPNDKAQCTLLMMVGLPGVGKSTWVRQYIRDHPDEKWDVINAEVVMSAMKVNGVARGRAHTGRWDMVLGLVAKALQKMVLLAARRRRNYIVDLSNVNKDSRKRRLMHFKDFTKKCIVIVPDEEEMVNRQMHQARQEGSSHVPAEAILEMKAVFTFPTEEAEGFDEVHLVEPAMPRIAEAIEIIQRFNDEGKPWYQKRYRGRGSRRGGRGGGYMGGGGGDRRGSDLARPLSVSTAASNGSGPPTQDGRGGGRSMDSPRTWGMSESPSTAGNFSWASRKSSN